MAKTSKSHGRRSTSTIDLGETRKKRINAFRAHSALKGTPMPKIDDAVIVMVDRVLEQENIPMEAA